MIPDIHMLEKLSQEHRQSLLREAEQKRRLAEGQYEAPLHSSRRFAARLGKYLVLIGTRLQRAQAVD